jgi:hypothetical protein
VGGGGHVHKAGQPAATRPEDLGGIVGAGGVVASRGPSRTADWAQRYLAAKTSLNADQLSYVLTPVTSADVVRRWARRSSVTALLGQS